MRNSNWQKSLDLKRLQLAIDWYNGEVVERLKKEDLSKLKRLRLYKSLARMQIFELHVLGLTHKELGNFNGLSGTAIRHKCQKAYRDLLKAIRSAPFSCSDLYSDDLLNNSIRFFYSGRSSSPKL